jgi:uncharacterized membrane protein
MTDNRPGVVGTAPEWHDRRRAGRERSRAVDFHEVVETIGKGVDLAGVVAIVLGALVATAQFIAPRTGATGEERYHQYRRHLGRTLLLGLELLVAADIIRTVAIEPTFESVGVLAGIVLIRTFLSFSLSLELEGHWPWQARARPRQGAPTPARADATE